MSFRTEIIKLGNLGLEHFSPEGEINEKKLLFVHSSGHGSWMWKNFLCYFAKRNYDSWAINLRGHYLSDPVPDWAAVGLLEYLDDLDLAVEERDLVPGGHVRVAGAVLDVAGEVVPLLDLA